MSIRRLFTHQLLHPHHFPASRDDFEVVSAFNPGAVRVGDDIILLVRVAEWPKERRADFTSMPRWDHGQLTIDWIANAEIEPLDPRVVRIHASGLVRLTFTSHLRVVRLAADGRKVKEITKVIMRPVGEVDEFGVEDPRITPIHGRFYITYVAVSRHGPATGLASTADFRTFEHHGIIFCAENKDVVLFPDMVGSKYAALHRPVCGTPFTRPEMWAARSMNLTHWGENEPLTVAGASWQAGRVGSGCPPFRVPEGWFTIYHGSRQPCHPGEVGEYSAGVLLLDPDHPAHILKWTTEPIMRPEEEFERTGFIPHVIFPTGIVEAGDEYLMFYGASDTSTAVVAFNKQELISAVH